MDKFKPQDLFDAFKMFGRSVFASKRAHSINGGGVGVLLELSHNKEGLKPSEIGQYLNISPSSVTPILNSLEGKNLIVRTFSKKDRRTTCIVITDEGLLHLKIIVQKKNQEILGLIEYLGSEDSEVFSKLLIKCADYFNTVKDDTI